MKRRLASLCLRLTIVTETVAAVLMLAIVAVNLVQVVFRYAVGAPLGWTEEMMRYSVVWMTFLASSAALYRGEHMSVSLVEGVTTAWFRHGVHVLVLTCIGAFCGILVWYGLPLAIQNWEQASPSSQIPMAIPYLSVAVGGALMLLKVICLLMMPPGFTLPDDVSGSAA